jgi:hypothetical protein
VLILFIVLGVNLTSPIKNNFLGFLLGIVFYVLFKFLVMSLLNCYGLEAMSGGDAIHLFEDKENLNNSVGAIFI